MITRKPKVENKYNIKPKDICHATIIDYKRLHQYPFWRNDVIQAWCLSGSTCKNEEEDRCCCHSAYWIGFYDQDAISYAGKIRLMCTSCGGMFDYKFKSFFNPKEINDELDLEIQEKLLNRINWLLDEKIIEIKK